MDTYIYIYYSSEIYYKIFMYWALQAKKNIYMQEIDMYNAVKFPAEIKW